MGRSTKTGSENKMHRKNERGESIEIRDGRTRHMAIWDEGQGWGRAIPSLRPMSLLACP